ncbi:hypothetical protein [Deinococcus cellulosilyticus]|uniref:SRPBCC family protein n=1 Tax=Deinococcus cellulosilyticus (strain DSM 18568 / NBRC 106333 / KACC 11606 / 5516J-15) TaxID=1223518 RepID=A0A511MYP1_DEIC1|nr:hypothetical protein [Deinococcus cellulosilyticus]GEM45689.1 hypothetical protein DC3_13240 [Deinococcus cellulosilyticus NBRC 106333 = KACC 11606]
MRIIAHIWIHQPLNCVYQTLANHSLDGSWRTGVTGIQQSHPGTVQVGTCLEETLHLMGRTLHTDSTVVYVQEGVRHDFVGTCGGFPLSGSRSFQASMNRTRVTLELQLTPPESWLPYVSLLKFFLHQRIRQDLRQLKSLLERTSHSPQTPSYS